MSVTVQVNNTNYTIPQEGETSWGNNVTQWIQAASQHLLQKSGGTFTLSAEVDFGSSYGIKTLVYKTKASNPSSAGAFRLGNAESIGWRNVANSGDLLLTVNASDKFTFNSVEIADI